MRKTLKTIRMDLSTASINQAIREVKKFQRDLNNAMVALCETLLDQGVKVAQMKITQMNPPAVYTGDLYNSVTRGAFNKQTGVGFITVGEGLQSGYGGMSYAVFVEFGTGPVGSRNRHPLAGEVGYAYNVNKEEHIGMYGDDLWCYRNPNDGKLHWTRGMRARPFMYETMMELALEAGRRGGIILTREMGKE